MNLVSEVQVNGTKMYLYLGDTQSTETFMLIHPYHREDRFNASAGGEIKHAVVKKAADLKRVVNTEYVVESIKRMKKTGKVFKYGTSEVLESFLDQIAFARSYRFDKNDIMTNTKDVKLGEEMINFTAIDSKLQFSYTMQNGLYTYLYIDRPEAKFELKKYFFALKLDKNLYKEVERKNQKRVLLASIKKVDYGVLEEVLDMSWYKKDGILQKNYHTIKSNEEFEEQVFTPLCKRIIENKKAGKVTEVAIDTETTGLNLYCLSDSNPDKDHCVAIPICWEEGNSFVIFTDMMHFTNASNEYVMTRLEQLFSNFKGQRTITYYDVEDGKTVQKQFILERKDVLTDGHNSGFDRRVFYSHGYDIWFDEDSLQMAFDINPLSVRGSKSLKTLTRLIFHSETPELSDVLGKGNEDKYRYLEDEEVAKIYGCADADFTLGVRKYLKHLMSREMYHWYKKQDIPMINILAVSEYYGMNTIADKVKILAEETKQNVKILQNTMYEYVGVYLQYINDINKIKARYKAGVYSSEEEYKAALDGVKANPNARFEFEFKPANLKQVIYDYMKYPIFAYTEGRNKGKKEPKLDKYVVKKLLSVELDEGEEGPRKLAADVLKYGVSREEYDAVVASGNEKKAASMRLISAEEFNKLKYPLALILKEYSSYNKEYTSYYKPMETQNLEGKIFKGYNLARIETRRIANPGQTMKKDLKALIRSYTDDHYLLDFDMSQVEYRIMASRAGALAIINKMKDPEADYHIETASMIEAIPPYRVTKDQRKSAKCVGFGVPYGLGDRSLCETMFGKVTPETLMKTRLTLQKWRKANKEIVDFLEKARAQALTEWKISDELRTFMDKWKKDENGNYVLDENGNKIPIPISKVENMYHFYRTFDLTNVDLSAEGRKRRAAGEYTAEESAIRRKAGNYPIQATASEIFRLILIRFYEACEKYKIQDKVIWHMLIHDELLCSVKKDVHPFLLYKIIKEACMITMPGHTNYFVGINIGDTWKETKDDSREAPIHMVDRMIAKWDAGEFKEVWFDHPWDFIKPYRDQYILDRIDEIISDLQPGYREGVLDLENLLDNFSNYTVRAYVNDFKTNGSVGFKPDKKDPDSVERYNNAEWIKKLESWSIEKFGEGLKFRGLDGEVYEVHKCLEETPKTKSPELDDFDDDFDDDFEKLYDDDEDDALFIGDDVIERSFESSQDLSENQYSEDEFQYDFNNQNAHDVNEMTIVESKYKYVKELNGQVMITVDNQDVIEALKVLLQPDRVKVGSRVVFRSNNVFNRWEKIRQNVDLVELDKAIDTMVSDGILQWNNLIFIPKIDYKHRKLLTKELTKYSGVDFTAYFFVPGGVSKPVSFSKGVDIGKLTKIIESWR